MKKTDKRRQVFLWIISVLVAVSMICSFVVLVAPPQTTPATPTPTPTLTATALASTPTLTPTALPSATPTPS